MIYLQFNQSSKASIEIFDEIGKMRITKMIDSNEPIYVGDLSKGLYIIKITISEHSTYEKIILE